jgi:hypothetical protein
MMRHSHLIVLDAVRNSHRGHNSHDGERLVARLRRMAIGRVTVVTHIEEARHLCGAGGVDACLLVMGDTVPDAISEALMEAPGLPFGVTTLIVASVVTPYVRNTARLRGYRAVLPARIAPRMLYRRISAVLQGRRRRRPPASGRMMMMAPAKLANLAKPTVH